MIEQERIELSKQEFRKLADKRGLVSHISDKVRPNDGRPLVEPLDVTDHYREAHPERKAALDEAMDRFWDEKD